MALESGAPKRRLRIQLRGLFVWVFYLAVGLTIGARVTHNHIAFSAVEIDRVFIDWHDTFLVVASQAMAVGLVGQARTITRQGPRVALDVSQRFGWRLEVAWRTAAALGLVLEVALQLLISRGYFAPPVSESIYFPTLLTTVVWWLLVALPLAEAALRGKPIRRHGVLRRLLDAAAWSVMIGVLLYLTIDKGMIQFLVHVACRGVDASLAHTGNRYWIVTAEQERQIAAAAALAAVSAIAGGALLFQVFRRFLRPASSLVLCAVALVLLAIAGSYCRWYYAEGLPRLSPDLAAGSDAGWFDLLGGVILALTIVTAGAIRLVRRASLLERLPTTSIDLGPAAESLPVLLCLAGATGVMLVLTIVGSFDAPYGTPAEMLAYALFDTDTTFSVALFLLSAYLLWRRRRHPVLPPLEATWIHPRRFIAAWLALAITLAVTVPTLAALSLSFWLGPWYRW